MSTADFLDMRTVFLRIAMTYPCQSLPWRELSTCWRPTTEKGTPWRDDRLSNAIEAMIGAGYIEHRDTITGYELAALEAGFSHFDVHARPRGVA